MCKECGCASGHGSRMIDDSHHHDHPDLGGHHPDDGHSHGFTVDVNRSLLEKNDRLAAENRSRFAEKKLLVLNVVSSPGSGKTSLIRETAARLSAAHRVGVIVGDLATDNDAERLRTVGVPVVQITTGTVCHLDAGMVARAADRLPLDDLEILIIENVGNLVCPADYDLGEDLRVVLLSVTEGEDKPLKYPPMFHSATVAIITKTDMSEAAGFDRVRALNNLTSISHHARIFEVSAKTGQGMDQWILFVTAKVLERRSKTSA